MRRAIEIAVVILLTVGGIALFYYYSSPQGLALPALSVFLRRAALRAAGRLLALPLLVLLIPLALRRRGRKLWRECKVLFRFGRKVRTRVWRQSPWPVRILLAAVFAVCSAVLAIVLWVLTTVGGQRVPYAGPWVRSTAMPFLARSAAARGVERHVPDMWVKMPRRARALFDRTYRRLMWIILPQSVRIRREAGARFAALFKKTPRIRGRPHSGAAE